MDSSPRLFETAARIVPEAGSQEDESFPWRLAEVTSPGTPIPEAGEMDPGIERLPLSGSWLHAYSPSEHVYPCDDDGACACAHCMDDACDCEDCAC